MNDSLQFAANIAAQTQSCGGSINWWMVISIIEFAVIVILLLGRTTKHYDKRSRIKQQVKSEGDIDFDEIAKTRGLVISTIVNHLSHYVAQGQLEPSDIIAPERAEIIANYLKNNPQHTLTTVREALKNEFSYDEIRLVMAWVGREQ